MRTKIVLGILISLSFLSLLLLLTGFGYALGGLMNPVPSPLPSLTAPVREGEKRDGALTIVALGDSLTRGVGDGDGLGYVGRVVERLKKERKIEAQLTNLAVSGATSTDLDQQLKSSGIRYAVSKADVILLTIGGNDLNPGFERLDKVNLKRYTGDIEAFLTNGKGIITQLRRDNPKAPIYWLGLYNPFEDILPETNQTVLVWNQKLDQLLLAEPGVYLVPLFDLFHQRTKRLLYTDHFHPNRDGYEAIAERLYSGLLPHLLLWKGEGS